MRKSFSGVTFTPGVGVEVWSGGKRVKVSRHLYATRYGGADQDEHGEPLTLCGLVKAEVTTVHVSKARKTDCTECRRVYRARVRGEYGI